MCELLKINDLDKLKITSIKNVYNLDNIKSIDVVENAIYVVDDILSNKGTLIGEYEREERAAEVLLEFLNFYREEIVINFLEEHRDKFDWDKLTQIHSNLINVNGAGIFFMSEE